MIKKIILISASLCFTLNAFAASAPLSADTLQKCKDYLSSPKTVTPDAKALTQCYQANVCGNNPEFSSIDGCTKNLMLWNFQASAPKAPVPQSTTNTTNTTNATNTTNTTSTTNTSNTVNTTNTTAQTDTKPTPKTTDAAPTETTNTTTPSVAPGIASPDNDNSNQGKPQKQTINWF